MIVRSIEQWQALSKQHDESGLKASEFCRKNKLCPRYFSKRKRDLGWKMTLTPLFFNLLYLSVVVLPCFEVIYCPCSFQRTRPLGL
jgi:hypothetical protein